MQCWVIAGFRSSAQFNSDEPNSIQLDHLSPAQLNSAHRGSYHLNTELS